MGSADKIRVAVFTRGDALEAWEIAALNAVKQLPFAEIVLEVRDASFNSRQNNRGLIGKIVSYNWKRLLWNRWFKKYGKVDATREISSAQVFAGVPKLNVVPELKGKYSQHFSPADLEKVKAAQPDVMIRFGFNILRGEILNVAPHGVWSYHHADHETIRGGPAGFWEYIRREHITGAILQRLTDKLDDGVVLRSGYWPLVKHSFRENLDALLHNSSAWIANALTEIHLNGKIIAQPSPHTKGKVYSYPGNFCMLQFWSILFGNKLAFHWNNLFRPETWQVGIVDQPIKSVLANGIQGSIRWLRAKKNDSYLADPFAVKWNGHNIIAAEYFSGDKQRSHLVNAETEETLIEQEYHLSFPLPVDIDGKEYLLPEMSASGTSRLFAVDNPNETRTLLDAPLVDPVLFRHNGTWWLFTHLHNNQNNSALFIYYTHDVNGGFTPHPLNPVKTDIRNSRAAGAVFQHSGKLIRPAQDSAVTYGKAIVLNEITTLTTTAYSEQPVQRITADQRWAYSKGIHTISAYGNQTLIDAKSFRFNFANFKAQFSRKARRVSGK